MVRQKKSFIPEMTIQMLGDGDAEFFQQLFDQDLIRARASDMAIDLHLKLAPVDGSFEVTGTGQFLVGSAAHPLREVEGTLDLVSTPAREILYGMISGRLDRHPETAITMIFAQALDTGVAQLNVTLGEIGTDLVTLAFGKKAEPILKEAEDTLYGKLESSPGGSSIAPTACGDGVNTNDPATPPMTATNEAVGRTWTGWTALCGNRPQVGESGDGDQNRSRGR